MHQRLSRSNWPYCDSTYPDAFSGEKDSCGVGFIASVEGKQNHWVLSQALRGLSCMEHRGGCGGDGDSGDGAGILCEIPWSYLRKVWETAKECEPQSSGIGMIFMPKDSKNREIARKICEQEAESVGLTSKGWRNVPVQEEVLGKLARENEPFITQWIVNTKDKDINLEALLFRLRQRISNRANIELKEDKLGLYICSLSSKTIVYKGMVRSEILAPYYADLNDDRFEVSYAVYHRRFSTNTLPKWPLAQPMRLLGHNGEINTLLGNINWAKATETDISSVWKDNANDLKPIVNNLFSDSANLDLNLELLVRSGRPITDSLLTLIPEAFRDQPELINKPEITAFYEYAAGTQEPWDGPALIVFTDGRNIGATLDRNGLRPARYCITKNGYVVMGSETGVVELEENQIQEKGRLGPGQMLAVDLDKKRILRNWDVKEESANRYPYLDWLKANRINLSIQNWEINNKFDKQELLQQQIAFGFSAEDFDYIINDMAANAKEPTYCMGDDIPLAILSNKSHILYDYFKQRFAQVTNPPIDPLREKLVTSLEMHLGVRKAPLSPKAESARLIHIKSPIINEKELTSIKNSELSCKQISTLIPINGDHFNLDEGLKNLCQQAEDSVINGGEILILSDRNISREKSYIPPLLAVGAVHHHLLKKGLRLKASIIIDTAQCWSTHHIACLIGFGASAICPWLTWETTRHWWQLPKTQKLISDGKLSNLSIEVAQYNVKKAMEDGLRKILSKIGISVLASYHGAQIFEAIGIGADLINLAFKGTTSRIAGLTLSELSIETISFHKKAFPELEQKKLDFNGFVQYRSSGEFHLNNPEMSKILHAAVKAGPRYDHFKTYQQLLESRPATTLRDLLTFKTATQPLPLDQIESVESICQRFCTGGMSLGALSREAHEVLAIAMNRIGGKSNSGEGGEDPARFNVLDDVDENNQSKILPNLKGLVNGDTACSAIKQIASGRFGVTPEYLTSGKQLEIKVAQGAKPGEGGQLPGPKVDEYIAKLRNSKPGVALISPPPHHDIYSIEDLAQLIHDLHQINPTAKVSVKLVAEIGIGTIAGGVAKANADVIQISGHDGGTGASPLSSIKHAGLPWELGLTEVHRSLLENGLRERVLLRADGGLKTGWDVLIAALLGAEEYGFGTVAMIAEGCIMARICHTNKCPVGIATQQEGLRKRFPGLPEHVVNFFIFVAEEVRQLMSQVGVAKFEDLIGRTDLLIPRNIDLIKTKEVDLSSLLKPIDNSTDRSWLSHEIEAHSNGEVLENALLKDEEVSNALQTHGSIIKEIPIVNTDRSVCARISGEIAKKYGNKGFNGNLNLIFKGSAGQSFGAFILKGMNISLIGEANDYVGKGINGGSITIVPEIINDTSNTQVILGNTCLYGATGGKLFALGIAGERFGVRNSGAHAVIEGAGDHCCEYMTGGVVVVLGKTGRNIGAGMTGGIAFILDKKNELDLRMNKEIVEVHHLTATNQEQFLHDLIFEYHQKTKSPLAQKILADWSSWKKLFKAVVPPSEKSKLGIEEVLEKATI